MDSVLLVSGGTAAQSLTQLLRDASFRQVSVAGSGAEARRLTASYDYDVVLINAPLSDEFGHDLALQTAESTASGVLLLVKGELADEVSDRVEPYGVFVAPKPLSRAFFYQALRLIEASRRRLLGLRTENVKLQDRIEEIRLVDRAKCALIQYLQFTEPQAHRYIEKQAMDRRISRREVAEGILRTYETETMPGR